MEQAILASLADLQPDELAGAYRALCGMMLAHTALCIRRGPARCNEDAHQKSAARKWLTTRCGVLDFPECCEVFGLRPGRARQAIREFAAAYRDAAISTVQEKQNGTGL